MPLLEALTAGGSLVSGLLGRRSGRRTARMMADAQNRATAESRRQYDQTREDFAPWREAGGNALARVDRYLGGDDSDFFTSPDYEFRRGEGMRDIGNFYSGGPSGVYSGNAMRRLAEFNSGLASGEIQNWFNRQFGVAEAGRGATGSTASAGERHADRFGNIVTGTTSMAANALTRGDAAVNDAVQGGIGNYLYGRQRWGGGRGEDDPLMIDLNAMGAPRRRYA